MELTNLKAQASKPCIPPIHCWEKSKLKRFRFCKWKLGSCGFKRLFLHAFSFNCTKTSSDHADYWQQSQMSSKKPNISEATALSLTGSQHINDSSQFTMRNHKCSWPYSKCILDRKLQGPIKGALFLHTVGIKKPEDYTDVGLYRWYVCFLFFLFWDWNTAQQNYAFLKSHLYRLVPWSSLCLFFHILPTLCTQYTQNWWKLYMRMDGQRNKVKQSNSSQQIKS